MKKLILPITWIMALAAVIAMITQMQGAATHFFGIADNKEQTISFSYPVKIETINVVEGQQVNAQQIVIQVSKRELDSKKAIIEDQIEETQSKHQQAMAAIRAELKSLQAKKAATFAEIDGKIAQLRSKYQVNMTMLAEISGNDNQDSVAQSSPLLAEIKALKTQRNHLGRSMQAQIDNLTAQLNKTSNRPIDAQLAELREIKTQLKQQETELLVKTTLSGRVGSILYKANEQVAPFEPILTIQGATPSFVKGYIHEDVLNNVKIGQQVWVKSKSPHGVAGMYRGKVQSLGNRIVEYPQRLLKNPTITAWGREVVITIPADNKFLAGEKVEVFLHKPVKQHETLVAWVTDKWSTFINGHNHNNTPDFFNPVAAKPSNLMQSLDAIEVTQ